MSRFWVDHPVVFWLLVFFALGCLTAAGRGPDRGQWWSPEDIGAMHREGREPPQPKLNFWRQFVWLLLVWDNLAGHHTPALVDWLVEQGVWPLPTPLGGSWLNLAESIQRILVRRALDGQHPTTPRRS